MENTGMKAWNLISDEGGIRPVRIRDLTLGDGTPRICVPIAAQDPGQFERILQNLKEKRDLYDMLELRADLYPKADLNVPDMIGKVRKALGDVVLLFTFRTKQEGGGRDITMEEYSRINLQAREAGADLVDLELAFSDKGEDHIGLLDRLHEKGTLVIGSFHDFHGTPAAEEITKKLVRMQMLGFDLTKAAVMPRDREDVLELLFASVQMKENWADRPFVTMSMGDLGKVTRLCGSFSGSAITFATVEGSSAPGQLPAAALREILPLLPLHKAPTQHHISP